MNHSTDKPIEVVLFDFDGTLADLTIDFRRMREDVEELAVSFGLEPARLVDLYVLEMIQKAAATLSTLDPGKGALFQEKAHAIVADHENTAARRGRVLPGVTEVLRALRSRGIKIGIITRNCAAAVRTVFPRILDYCDAFVPRDGLKAVKPHPAHLSLAMALMAVQEPQCCLMVGDHELDVTAGKRMNMKTAGVLTGGGSKVAFLSAKADFVFQDVTRLFETLFGE